MKRTAPAGANGAKSSIVIPIQCRLASLRPRERSTTVGAILKISTPTTTNFVVTISITSVNPYFNTVLLRPWTTVILPARISVVDHSPGRLA